MCNSPASQYATESESAGSEAPAQPPLAGEAIDLIADEGLKIGEGGEIVRLTLYLAHCYYSRKF
jgi:hypothetical protein